MQRRSQSESGVGLGGRFLVRTAKTQASRASDSARIRLTDRTDALGKVGEALCAPETGTSRRCALDSRLQQFERLRRLAA
jgi:hypothetical protein